MGACLFSIGVYLSACFYRTVHVSARFHDEVLTVFFHIFFPSTFLSNLNHFFWYFSLIFHIFFPMVRGRVRVRSKLNFLKKLRVFDDVLLTSSYLCYEWQRKTQAKTQKQPVLQPFIGIDFSTGGRLMTVLKWSGLGLGCQISESRRTVSSSLARPYALLGAKCHTRS